MKSPVRNKLKEFEKEVDLERPSPPKTAAVKEEQRVLPRAQGMEG